MSDEQEVLDDELAHKLRRAVQTAERQTSASPLGPQAQARVLAAMVREGRSLAQQKRRRLAMTLGAVAVAACALLMFELRGAQPEGAVVAHAITPAVCALPLAASDVAFASSAGRQLLSLGRFGRVAAAADAELRVIAATPCELIIRLEHGTLAAELNDLRPAHLTIQTALGEVRVRGTTFSVQVDQQLQVALLSGAVDVELGEGAPALRGAVRKLTPGHVLSRKSRQEDVSIALADAEHAATIERLIEPSGPPAPVASAASMVTEAAAPTASDEPRTLKSATELLVAAEAARRAGELDQARSWYRQAGARRGPDAEVAWLRWARLELAAKAPEAAERVLQGYRQHFRHGKLAAEASWLEVRTLEALGRETEAETAARALVKRFPNSPHAKSAIRLLPP